MAFMILLAAVLVTICFGGHLWRARHGAWKREQAAFAVELTVLAAALFLTALQTDGFRELRYWNGSSFFRSFPDFTALFQDDAGMLLEGFWLRAGTVLTPVKDSRLWTLSASFLRLLWCGLAMWGCLSEWIRPRTPRGFAASAVACMLFLAGYPWNAELYGYASITFGIAAALTCLWAAARTGSRTQLRAADFILPAFSGLLLANCLVPFFEPIWAGVCVGAVVAACKNKTRAHAALAAVALAELAAFVSLRISAVPLENWTMAQELPLYESVYGGVALLAVPALYGAGRGAVMPTSLATGLVWFAVLLVNDAQSALILQYLLWPLWLAAALCGLQEIARGWETLAVSMCALYTAMLLLRLTGFEGVLRERYPALDPVENIGSQFALFETNISGVSGEDALLTNDDFMRTAELAQRLLEMDYGSVAVLAQTNRGEEFIRLMQIEKSRIEIVGKSWNYFVDRHLYRSSYELPYSALLKSLRPEFLVILNEDAEQAAEWQEVMDGQVLFENSAGTILHASGVR